MGNILPTVFEPVLNICAYLVNQSVIGLYSLILCVLSFFGYSPHICWDRGTGLTLWEDFADDYGTLTLKHFEDLNEQVLVINAFNATSQIACKVLIIEKKTVGSIARCYVFKKIPGTDWVKTMKMPIPVRVKAVVELFQVEFDN